MARKRNESPNKISLTPFQWAINDKTINDRGHDLPLQTPVHKPHLKIERGNDNKQVT